MLTLIEIFGSSFLACWVKDTQVYLYVGCKLCFLLYWLYTNLNFVELNYSFSFICANTMERTLKQLVVASACSKMWDVVDVYYTKEDITRIVSEETAEGIKFTYTLEPSPVGMQPVNGPTRGGTLVPHAMVRGTLQCDIFGKGIKFRRSTILHSHICTTLRGIIVSG